VNPGTRRRHFWPIYLVWIALCAVLFLALRGAEDPSRRRGRILPSEAGRRAIAALQRQDPVRSRSYEVVHVAYAREGEGAPEKRWVVLVDAVPRTALRQAVVVELRAEDGSLLRVRRPVR
jgi:hypothetical protein